ADIHFTPNAAEIAARLVEKVRINPGNYADKKKFETLDYSDSGYQAELDRIREKFLPLVHICKEYGTAMRIGTNHGSLSDRILSRYGDTPLGMVESALEFLRICEAESYYNIVISMKASNTQVMVQAYRLLVQKLNEEGLKPYPLHLGVTEAGEAEDGRIKSAVGIGTLLEDGLGDTVRVSLTEEPEFEIPVARALVERYDTRKADKSIKPYEVYPIDPFQYHKRSSKEVFSLGDRNVPRVIADLSRLKVEEMKDLKAIGHHYLPEPDKWHLDDQGADFIYAGSQRIPFMVANGTRVIYNSDLWETLDETEKSSTFPSFTLSGLSHPESSRHELANFVQLQANELQEEVFEKLSNEKNLVLILKSSNSHAMADLRRFMAELMIRNLNFPVIINRDYTDTTETDLSLFAATDVGGLLIDGLGDGIMLNWDRIKNLKTNQNELKVVNQLAFGILQAARTRMSKTEYISCPSCGRTLFDLQETTAMIRKRTDHLKGIKIGIMGCIVNGPGEMADADYGYVGVGKDKIALYRGQNVVKKSVPAGQAVDELIELIREDGNWIQPENILQTLAL
ncbi:MAG TPA: flavodoxin-dependent (E)-4-hydroxy-3-methylbut-2-enyl-diphosphate synthase, partial [Catalimonadaceae bacterium]|nr:flavodoxin-dependent (E)-4-hydroxy-3-methylbut-2-enyl-diphosphate synthase [Catalimonadaceae bacterium]